MFIERSMSLLRGWSVQERTNRMVPFEDKVRQAPRNLRVLGFRKCAFGPWDSVGRGAVSFLFPGWDWTQEKSVQLCPGSC